MNCSVGTCSRTAVVVVRFQYVKTPYAYCDLHGYRRGRLVWRKGVRHVQEVRR
jgi:hypothetical protein